MKTETRGGDVVAGLGVAIIALSVAYLVNCATFKAIKPIVHNANEAAQAVCEAYMAAKTKSTPDSSAVVKFCSVDTNLAPFISLITSAQRQGKAGLPLQKMGCADKK